MEIKYTSQNFTGYDARKLKGLFVSDRRCAEQLKKLANTMDIDIFTPSIASKSIRKELAEVSNSNSFIWAQDYITVVDSRAILFDVTREHISRVLRASAEGLGKTLDYRIKH